MAKTNPMEETNEAAPRLRPPKPQVPHWPIGLSIVNLNHLSDLAFRGELSGDDRESAPRFGQPVTAHGGQILRVTVKLDTPLAATEKPYHVELRYHAYQKEAQPSANVFLFSKTEQVTFFAGTLNNGDQFQTFDLQTIRFDMQTAQNDTADIIIQPYVNGQHAGDDAHDGKLTLEP